MSKTTREFLKENGLMFKASYMGLSAVFEQHSPQTVSAAKSEHIWNITLSSGAQRFTFETKTPADSSLSLAPGSRIQPPTPESAMEILSHKIKPASMGHEAWGNLSAGLTAPLRFGEAYTSQALTEAFESHPESVKNLNTVGRTYVESVATYNNLTTTLGANVANQLLTSVDFSPVEVKHEQRREHAPSMR